MDLTDRPAATAPPPAPVAPQLVVSGLSKTYTAKEGPVLDGIDLEVAPGELVALLGPSGCGKSTLLRCVAGFLSPEQGSIRIAGRDVVGIPPHHRNVGLVFQNHALWPHMTVAENVAFGLEMRKVARSERLRRVGEALELVGLGGYERRYPPQLSGGQQQRVALARALVIQPQLLLLDEPLSALDANLRRRLRHEIRQLQQRLGVTTILVTHDREEAMSICDRVVLLEHGVMAQQGTPEELYRRPCSPFVLRFTGDCALLPAAVTSVDGGTASLRTPFGPARLPVDAGRRPSPGETWNVGVRPEDVALEARPDHLVTGARVLEVSFLGPVLAGVVELDDGTHLEVRAPSAGGPSPVPGDRLQVSVSPACLHLFPPSTNSARSDDE